MARFEGDIRARAAGRLTAAELFAILSGEVTATEEDRNQAIACFLSASDGWGEAVKRLGGAFATDGDAPGLKDGKAE